MPTLVDTPPRLVETLSTLDETLVNRVIVETWLVLTVPRLVETLPKLLLMAT